MGEPTFWLSRDEVRELDRRAVEEYGIPGVVLMENAGRGCAELLMRLNPVRKPTVILCGPGNNGGDGFVIARHLDNHGWPVEVWGFLDPKISDEARLNMEIVRWTITLTAAQGLLFPLEGEQLLRRIATPGVNIVDALFGTGLKRPMDHPFDFIVRAVNDSGNPVLAVDIPSGLDCDTGEPLGPTVRAAHTATFVAHKKGFRNPAAREWTGEVHVIDIGAPRKLVDEYRRLRDAT